MGIADVDDAANATVYLNSNFGTEEAAGQVAGRLMVREAQTQLRLVLKTKANPGTQFQPWTVKEVARLRDLADMGAEGVAEELGRTLWSVRNAARKHRISLRRPGIRGGLILGQPRSVSFADAKLLAAQLQALSRVRADVLAGKVDMGRLEREVRRAHLVARGVPLCPRCAKNPQERAATGLCEDCHLRELVRVYELGQRKSDEGRNRADTSTVREYNNAKQRRSRERRKEDGDNE